MLKVYIEMKTGSNLEINTDEGLPEFIDRYELTTGHMTPFTIKSNEDVYYIIETDDVNVIKVFNTSDT